MPTNLSNNKYHITYDKFFFVASRYIVILSKKKITFFMLSHILTMSPLVIMSNKAASNASYITSTSKSPTIYKVFYTYARSYLAIKVNLKLNKNVLNYD